MNAALFDTHQMVKRLMAAGFSDTQAETVTDVVRGSRQFDLENLATKTDVAACKADLRAEIAESRGDMNTRFAKVTADIANCRAETLRWTIGLMIAQTGVILAVTRMMIGH